MSDFNYDESGYLVSFIAHLTKERDRIDQEIEVYKRRLAELRDGAPDIVGSHGE